MKRWRKFFVLVQTCIKPNLVLSEISEMKSEMKRWRVRWRDEQIKKFFFWSKHVSSQIWCYLKLVRWRDETDEEKFFFGSEHVSSQIWCYLKLVRWRNEQMKKIFFGSEHVSSQIWCYLKLVRWRVRWRDEQMKKNFFLVRTCIKPNLVLSEISEMKRWRKIFFLGPNMYQSQIWCYLKLVRWRVRWRDEQIENFFFLGPNMYQAKSGVIWN